MQSAVFIIQSSCRIEQFTRKNESSCKATYGMYEERRKYWSPGNSENFQWPFFSYLWFFTFFVWYTILVDCNISSMKESRNLWWQISNSHFKQFGLNFIVILLRLKLLSVTVIFGKNFMWFVKINRLFYCHLSNLHFILRHAKLSSASFANFFNHYTSWGFPHYDPHESETTISWYVSSSDQTKRINLHNHSLKSIYMLSLF